MNLFILIFDKSHLSRIKNKPKLLTVARLLRRPVDRLPSTVTIRQVRPGHPHVVPHVEVPARVVRIASRVVVELLTVHVDISVDG